MSDVVHCAICQKTLRPAESYVVRTEVFAAPEVEPLETHENSASGFEDEWASILAELEQLTPEEAQRQVHQAFEYRLCAGCRAKFVANPLGLPRGERVGSN